VGSCPTDCSFYLIYLLLVSQLHRTTWACLDINTCFKARHVCFTVLSFKKHATEAYGKAEVQIYVFVASAPDGGKSSPSRVRCFVPGERLRHLLCRVLGGLRADPDALEKDVCCPCGESSPESWAFRRV
jgi:hypothetical protein